MSRPVIALTTDFGVGSTYVAQLKAVLLASASGASIIDIAHNIPAQSVVHAQLSLRSTAYIFAPGTVHLVVVDPGVGTNRKPLAIESRGMFFVGPDNGVFGQMLAEPDTRAVVLDKPHLFREPVSNTFHGRDIFAPVAAELSAGLTLEDVGTSTSEVCEGQLQMIDIETGKVRVPLLAADNFGNLLTHLHKRQVPENAHIFAENKVIPLVTHYGEAPDDALVALFGSDGYLELAVKNGSAAMRLGSNWATTTLMVDCPLHKA